MVATALDRIRAAIEAVDDGRLVAVGWATVELDRAALELAALLGLTTGTFVPADDSTALGGRCRVASGVLPDGLTLALLEPNTEGRLAGRLARMGEGPAAVWSSVGADVARGLTGARPGPFGLERLLPGGPAQGPYRLVIGGPGTIAP
jgi:hypothetical protein